MTPKRQFQGFPFPIVKTPLGLLPVQNGTEQIKADLLILLMTSPGERVMLPDFGVGLKDFLFEQNDDVVVEQVKQRISDAITKWEPRVAITDIAVSINADDFKNNLNSQDDLSEADHILYVAISFRDPNDIQSINKLVIELPA